MRNRRKIWWIKRIISMVIVVFTTFTLTFFLMHTAKGDPFTATIENLPNDVRQKYIEQYGFNQPIIKQYFIFLKRFIMQGDLGVSLHNRTSTVTDVIRTSMPASLLIGGLAVVIGTVVGYLLGICSAYTRFAWLKELISTASVLGMSVPVYILAPFIQNKIAVKLHLLPVSGWGTWQHLILPVICMLPLTIATITKYTKGSIEQVRRSGYYIAAKQRGFTEAHIFRLHVVKNSAPPIVTVVISNVSAVFSGSFIVEKIFSVPGIGREFMTAINTRDYTIIIGLNIVFTGIYVTFMLLGDLIQGICNPRFTNPL